MDDYNGYVQIIKDTITVPQMLKFYGFQVGRDHRMPCPFHNGKDRNLGVKDHMWHCFVCGVGGDVIAFVREYFHLDFRQAVEQINRDFHLGFPIGERLSLRQAREAQHKASEAIRRAKERQAEQARLREEYEAALDVYVHLQQQIQNNLPQPDQPVSEAYIYAIFRINEACGRLEEAESRLYIYEHQR